MIVDRIIFGVSVIIFLTTVVPITIWAFMSTKKNKDKVPPRTTKHLPQQIQSDPRRELATGIFKIINRQVAQVMEKCLPDATVLNYFDLWGGIYSAVKYQFDQYLISDTVLNVFSNHVVSVDGANDFNKVKHYISLVCDDDNKFFEIFKISTKEMLDDSEYISLYLNLVFANIEPTSIDLLTSFTDAIRTTDNVLHQFL